MRIPERLGVHPSLYDLWGELPGPVRVATALVALCHAGADGVFRQKYALKWWSELLPERVVLAALTSSTLAAFTAELSRRLHGQIGTWSARQGPEHRALWQEMIAVPVEQQRRVLDVLETQASVCTTLVRADLEAWREAQRQGEQENGPDAETDDPHADWSPANDADPSIGSAGNEPGAAAVANASRDDRNGAPIPAAAAGTADPRSPL